MTPPSPAPQPPGWLAEAGLLFVVAVWGLNFAVIKVPLDVMDPFTVNLFRFAVALAALGALHAWDARQRREGFWDGLRREPLAVVGLGLLAHVVYQTGFILGIDRLTAGMGALLMATAPLWTALIAHASGVDRLRGAAWAGVALGLAGAVVIVLSRPANAEMGGTAAGIALLLAGAFAWAVFTVLAKPVIARGVSPIGLTFFGLLAAFPVLFAMGAGGVASAEWARVDGWVWAALVFSGGLSIGAAYAIWNVAVRRIGPSRTALYSNLVPFAGVAAGAVLLREAVVPLQLVGGALVIAGLVVVRRA